jgi:hypothetical protein
VVVCGPLLALAAVWSLAPRMGELMPLLQGNPGYAQRVTLALYFLWLALASLVALRSDRRR